MVRGAKESMKKKVMIFFKWNLLVGRLKSLVVLSGTSRIKGREGMSLNRGLVWFLNRKEKDDWKGI
jgi:hypothetical protein